MFWRDITLSVWRKKTTGLKTKKRLLPLVLAAALCSSPVQAEEATFTANFKDTDLKSFIETVGANLNKTIIMGPGVQGKVSIRTMTPLNERQYYQLFLNLLEAQGYAVVPMENDVLKVVKSSAAKVEPLPLVGEGSDNYAGDEMVTKVVPVRNVSVRELAPILRQMIDSAGSGNVVNYDPSNVIMLTGRASVVERLTEVIQRVDHAGNRTEEVIPLDNQEAFFMVGQDVPVLTGSTVGSNNSNPFNTVERKKVGIMLKVTPQINEGNAVQMVIEQEVSKVEGQTSLDVVFGERKLKTTVLANDGELIVLGGLMDDQAGESVAKVPLLGDIPLIGNLFKSTADKKEKRNLMVFIRPTILRDGMAADGVSQRKYNYMRAEQIYRDEQGLSLMPHTAQPVLPAQNQALPPEVRAFLNAGRTR
ncbi:hypothetical protein H5S60_03350 [Escherichia coli]|nr:hypothetical protein [Escherichia coli]